MVEAITSQVDASRTFGSGSRRWRSAFLGSLMVTAAVSLGGCGSASDSTGARKAAGSPTPPKISAKLHAEEVAIHKQVLASLHAPTPKGIKPGVVPRYIPKSTLRVGRVVTATPDHPQLAIQGNSLRIKLAHASVLTSVVGPYVPIKYSGTNDPIVPGSFVVTFSHVQGRIPLDASDFHITDALGTSLFPSIDVRGGGHIPATLPTGHSLTLVFHDANLTIGQGYFEYNPFGTMIAKGKRPMANWDIDIESD